MKTKLDSMERTLSFSVASVVEDVLQQHGNRLGNGGGGLDLESRRAEEAGNSAFSNLLFPKSLESCESDELVC